MNDELQVVNINVKNASISINDMIIAFANASLHFAVLGKRLADEAERIRLERLAEANLHDADRFFSSAYMGKLSADKLRKLVITDKPAGSKIKKPFYRKNERW